MFWLSYLLHQLVYYSSCTSVVNTMCVRLTVACVLYSSIVNCTRKLQDCNMRLSFPAAQQAKESIRGQSDCVPCICRAEGRRRPHICRSRGFGRRKARALDTWAEEEAKPEEEEGLDAVNRPRLVNRVSAEPLCYCRPHHSRTPTLATWIMQLQTL